APARSHVRNATRACSDRLVEMFCSVHPEDPGARHYRAHANFLLRIAHTMAINHHCPRDIFDLRGRMLAEPIWHCSSLLFRPARASAYFLKPTRTGHLDTEKAISGTSKRRTAN